MEEQINKLIPLIKMNVGKLEKDMNHELMQYDITFSQSRVIILLYDSVYGNLSMKELEKIFQVTQQTMLGIVKRLEKKDLVESYSDPLDMRVKRIHLTESGQNLGKKVYESFHETQTKIDRALTQQEQETLVFLLRKLYVSIAQSG
ncbi:MAG: MarR family transcriptional regulator [Clostridiales bacterium]|nr:MarR family transcriptional regulator [Lachnospiraceae bacterium]MCD8110881.1 MarR family transcriptional regulator [Clostridiales bacterium]